MNGLTDLQLFNTINKITNTKNLFSMSGYSVNKVNPYKNRRQEIIAEFVRGINLSRIGTQYKPITEILLTIKINKNPFLKGTQELEFILKECNKVGNYKKLFWIIK